LQNYFLGGFFVFARYGNRSVEEIVKEWLPIFPYSSVSVESELVGNYLQLSGGNIHQIRSLIELFEQGHPKQWTLIPLQKYPVVRFEQGACFSLHPTNVAHSCFDGVYYTILDFYRTLPDKSERDRAIQTLARSYGELVENYSEKLLKDIFQDRLIRLPISEEAGRKRCDFVVRYHNKIILIEVKTSRFTTPRYFACKSLVELRDLIENKVEVGTATNQLFQTIEDLRLNKVCHPELKGIDWTTTTIIPVIVSEEVLPSVPLIWENLYSKFDDILRSLDGGAGRVAHLRFLSIEDLFKILNVSHITDIGHLLSVWGQQENIRSNSLQNALLVLHHKYELSYELTEYEKIKAFALDRLNLSN
jgi:hypothetical protein